MLNFNFTLLQLCQIWQLSKPPRIVALACYTETRWWCPLSRSASIPGMHLQSLGELTWTGRHCPWSSQWTMYLDVLSSSLNKICEVLCCMCVGCRISDSQGQRCSVHTQGCEDGIHFHVSRKLQRHELNGTPRWELHVFPGHWTRVGNSIAISGKSCFERNDCNSWVALISRAYPHSLILVTPRRRVSICSAPGFASAWLTFFSTCVPATKHVWHRGQP